ncbi:hypothetical protein SAMN06265348_108157 [Pedobacter westerhofensis]|uniref:Uncharacterized protein n=1 Tax=Pedobacter westerhofensis TaxID=425512 RepID=A0A521EHS2_9SPHI|nr:hypothetical protein SAMN06265348_108157 [Pedobacter westerhofensis]
MAYSYYAISRYIYAICNLKGFIKALLLYNYTNDPYLLTFTDQLKKKRLHIQQAFAVCMLWVFAIALIPWSTLHHHEEEQNDCAKYGKMCMHKTHIGNESHNCLICSAHFEKDYLTSTHSFELKSRSILLIKTYVLITASYTALRGTSLRGPPIA